MSPRFHLPSHWLSAIQKLKYYFGLSLAVAGCLVALWGFLVLFGKPGTWLQPVKLVAISRLIAGAFAMGLGGRLVYSVSQYNSCELERDFIEDNIYDYSIDDDKRTIDTIGGNYNKSIAKDYIQGDYITIQGDYININSDLSEVADQLLEIVTRLRDEGHSKEESQQLVTDDLVNQAKNNPTVKVKLRHWGQSIGNIGSENSLSETATAVVQAATETSLSVPSTEVVQAALTPDTILSDLEPTLYQQLENFLRAGNWKEADQATASIIFDPLLEEYGYKRYIITSDIESHIALFSADELRFINDLWLKYSQGHFGFSVQKDIWRAVDKDYQDFGERVGWYVEDDWIYQSDITYSLKAPRGHLPILVLLVGNYNVCQSCSYGQRSLNIFASRIYKSKF